MSHRPQYFLDVLEELRTLISITELFGRNELIDTAYSLNRKHLLVFWIVNSYIQPMLCRIIVVDFYAAELMSLDGFEVDHNTFLMRVHQCGSLCWSVGCKPSESVLTAMILGIERKVLQHAKMCDMIQNHSDTKSKDKMPLFANGLFNLFGWCCLWWIWSKGMSKNVTPIRLCSPLLLLALLHYLPCETFTTFPLPLDNWLVQWQAEHQDVNLLDICISAKGYLKIKRKTIELLISKVILSPSKNTNPTLMQMGWREATKMLDHICTICNSFRHPSVPLYSSMCHQMCKKSTPDFHMPCHCTCIDAQRIQDTIGKHCDLSLIRSFLQSYFDPNIEISYDRACQYVQKCYDQYVIDELEYH